MVIAIFSLLLCVIFAPILFVLAFILAVGRFIFNMLARLFDTLSLGINKGLYSFIQLTSSLWHEVAK